MAYKIGDTYSPSTRPMTPEESFKYIQTFVDRAAGKYLPEGSPFYVSVEPHIGGEGEGNRGNPAWDLVVGKKTKSGSIPAKGRTTQNTARLTVNLYGNHPLFGDSAYPTTTAGFIPVSETQENEMSVPFGANGQDYVDPWAHAVSLMVAGAAKAETGVPLQSSVNAAINLGSTIDWGGQKFRIPGLQIRTHSPQTGAESANAIWQKINSPQIVTYGHDNKEYGGKQKAISTAVSDLNAGNISGIPQIPGVVFGAVTVKGVVSAIPNFAYGGAVNEEGVFGLSSKYDKNAATLMRENSPLVRRGHGRIVPLEQSKFYHPLHGVEREGETPPTMLRAKAVVPLLFSQLMGNEGSGLVSLPREMFDPLHKTGEHIEAGLQSRLHVGVYGIRGPEDLFYTENGERRLRPEVVSRFRPENLAKQNELPLAETTIFAKLHGKSSTHNAANLGVSTKQRPAGVQQVGIVLPQDFLERSQSNKFTNEQLLPALAREGIRAEFQHIPVDKQGNYDARLFVDVLQSDVVGFKNASKIGASPAPRDAFHIYDINPKTGKLRTRESVDAVLPMKNLAGMMERYFFGSDRNIQKKLLGITFGKNKGITDYLKGLPEDEPIAADRLQEITGTNAMRIMEIMADKVLGTKPIFDPKTGTIDKQVWEEQQAMRKKVGIGRDVGWLAMPDEYFAEGKKEAMDNLIRNRMEQDGVSRKQAQAEVDNFIAWKQTGRVEGRPVYTGAVFNEFAVADEMPVPTNIEYSGGYSTQYNELEETARLQAFPEIADFLEKRPQKMSATQYALTGVASAFSATMQGQGTTGRYVNISDAPTEGLNWNRQEANVTLSSLSGDYSSDEEKLEAFYKIAEKKFGTGLGFSAHGVFFPDFKSVVGADVLETELVAGEVQDEELQVRARGGLMSAVSRNLTDLINSGPKDPAVDVAKANMLGISAKFVGSSNTTKSQSGISSKYVSSSLISRDEIGVNDEFLGRLFKTMSVSQTKADIDKFNETTSKPFLGMVTRYPGTTRGTKGRPGATAVMRVLTESNSEKVRHLSSNQRQSGIRSGDVFMNPANTNFFGDFDMDTVAIAAVLAQAKNPKNAVTEWINMLDEGATPDLLKRVAEQLSPEAQKRAMDLTMEAFGGSQSEDPYSGTQLNYLRTLLGETQEDTLTSKRLSPMSDWDKQLENFNEQKSAMGNVYNPMKRLLYAAGTTAKFEPNFIENTISTAGAGLYQRTVDKKYVPEDLSKLMQRFFISGNKVGQGAGLRWGFKNSKGEKTFTNQTWNNTTSFEEGFAGVISSLLSNTPDESTVGWAHLLIPGGKPHGKLTPEQSNELGEQQIKAAEDLAPELSRVRGLPSNDRALAVLDLIKQNKIGTSGVLGEAVTISLSNYLHKLKNGDEIAKEKYSRVMDNASAIPEATERILSGEIGRDLYNITKGTKYDFEMVPDVADPGKFAGFMYKAIDAGISDSHIVQQAVQFWGGVHGLEYKTNKDGKQYVYSSTFNQALSSEDQIAEYSKRVRSAVPEILRKGPMSSAGGGSGQQLTSSGGGSVGGGNPPNLPPNMPPNLPPNLPPNSSAGNSYEWWNKYRITPEGRAMKAREHAKDVAAAYNLNVPDEETGRGTFDALRNLGTPLESNAPEALSGLEIPISAETGQPVKMTPLQRYEELIKKHGVANVNRAMQKYPPVKKELDMLGRLKKDAVLLFHGGGLLKGAAEEQIYGTFSGDPGSEGTLRTDNPDLFDVLSFSRNTYFGKSKKGLPGLGENEENAAWFDLNKRESDLHLAEKRYHANPTAMNRQAVLLSKAAVSFVKADKIGAQLAIRESHFGIVNPSERLSELDPRDPDFVTKFDAIKIANTTNYGEDKWKAEVGLDAEEFKKLSSKAQKQFGIATGGKAIESVRKENEEKELLVSSAKLASRFHELTALTGKLTEAQTAELKALRDGTTQRQVDMEISKKQYSEARDEIRKLTTSTQTGDRLTSAELDRAKITPGVTADTLKRYLGATSAYDTRDTEEEVAKQGKGVGSHLAGFARKVLGGFGLMYMRSMANIVMSGGDYGYEENVKIQNGISKALSGVAGPEAYPQYNPEADIAGAKAIYSGGGRIALNKLQEDMLRNHPGLANAGKTLFSGAGGFATTMWLAQSLGIGAATTSATGATVAGVGATAAVPYALLAAGVTMAGSAILNQFGKAEDQAGWIASAKNKDFVKVSDLSSGEYGKGTEWQSGWLAETKWRSPNYGYTYTNQPIYGTEGEAGQKTLESIKLKEAQLKIADMIKEDPSMTRKDAIKELGISDREKLILNKAYALSFVGGDTKAKLTGTSEEARIQAVQAWTYFNGTDTLEESGYETMGKLARAYDVGANVSGAAINLMQVTGNQYAANKGGVLDALADLNLTQLDTEKLDSVTKLATTLGVGWSKAAIGIRPQDVEGALHQWNPYTRKYDRQPELFAMGELISGQNGTLAQQFFQVQELARQGGTAFMGFAPGESPAELSKTMTSEEKIKMGGQFERSAAFFGSTAQIAKKFGVNMGAFNQAFEKISAVPGTEQQQNVMINAISNPTPFNIGMLTKDFTPDQQQLFGGASVTLPTGAITTMADLTATGVQQFTQTLPGGMRVEQGQLSGLPWGHTSWASQDWSVKTGMMKQFGADWSTRYREGSYMNRWLTAQAKGVEGPGGTTYAGQVGGALEMADIQYEMAMQSGGAAMKQLKLTGAFTTGINLEGYINRIINPQTGEKFNIDPNNGGFWGLEDRSIAMANKQQQWGFEQQERQMAMQNKYWQANTGLQQQQMTMQRGWAREDWQYQSNVREMQWGWKQEDYQENVRFMTGRERKLAERQQKRDTISFGMEGDQIDKQRKRQEELWKLEDKRFDLSKQQHEETMKFQQDELDAQKKFYKQRKQLEEEQLQMQRAYWVEQQALQKESIGASAKAAEFQRDLTKQQIISGELAGNVEVAWGNLNIGMGNFFIAVQEFVEYMRANSDIFGITGPGGVHDPGGGSGTVPVITDTGTGGTIPIRPRRDEISGPSSGVTAIHNRTSTDKTKEKTAIKIEINGQQFDGYITSLVDRSLG